MSALAILPAVHERFDALCHVLAKRGRGSNLRDLGTAFELAEELEGDAPDRAVVTDLVERLGLSRADLEATP